MKLPYGPQTPALVQLLQRYELPQALRQITEKSDEGKLLRPVLKESQGKQFPFRLRRRFRRS